VKGPSVVVKAKNKSRERFVELAGHFAVVASVVVKFSASWREGTVVNCGRNSRDRKSASAKNTLSVNIIVFITDDGSDPSRNNAHRGACV